MFTMSNWEYAIRLVMMFYIGFSVGVNWEVISAFAESIK